MDGSFGLGRESEIDEVNAEGFQSLCDVKTGETTQENDGFVLCYTESAVTQSREGH